MVNRKACCIQVSLEVFSFPAINNFRLPVAVSIFPPATFTSGLSRLLASEDYYAGNSFKSLSDIFAVSKEQMALDWRN